MPCGEPPLLRKGAPAWGQQQRTFKSFHKTYLNISSNGPDGG